MKRIVLAASISLLSLLVLPLFCGAIMNGTGPSQMMKMESVGGESWLSGWTYRKAHRIMGSPAGAQTDYPVQLQVDYGDGVDAGASVFLNSKCKPDFGDVRFTDSTGAGNLAYWMEKKVDGDFASFWVKVGQIPVHPNNATIYIYYGNAEASTLSNGDATFTFWDDFEGDLSKWSLNFAAPEISTDHPFEGSRGLKIAKSASWIQKNLDVTANTALRVWLYDRKTPATVEKFALVGRSYPVASIHADDQLYLGSSWYYYRFDTPGLYISSVSRTVGWHLFEITNYDATIAMWIDGQLQGLTFSGELTEFNIGSHWVANDEYGYFDVAIQRVYCDPEPVSVAWEAEEGGSHVWADAGLVEIEPDCLFTLSVGIADVVELYGFDVRLAWDTELLDYVSHAITVPVDEHPGGVLYSPVLLVKDEVNETAGMSWIACVSLLPAPSFNGSGTICEITFLTRAEGNCTVSFQSSQLSDADGQPIGHDVADAQFVIRDLDFHDVAVTAISLAGTVVGQGCVTTVNVTVANIGTYAEDCNVTLLANASILAAAPVVLVNGSSATIMFLWNTSGYVRGRYQISAEVTLLSEDKNPIDNYLIDGTVLVTITGDVNGDRTVDLFDLVLISRIYGIAKPDARYESRCDFDSDGDIDIFDILAAVANYAEHW